jgi:hypothetical protein
MLKALSIESMMGKRPLAAVQEGAEKTRAVGGGRGGVPVLRRDVPVDTLQFEQSLGQSQNVSTKNVSSSTTLISIVSIEDIFLDEGNKHRGKRLFKSSSRLTDRLTTKAAATTSPRAATLTRNRINLT